MSKNITITAMLSVLVVVLFSFQMVIPPIGMIFSYLSVILLIEIKRNTETRYYLMSLITTSTLIVMLNDPFGWILYIFMLIPVSVGVIYEGYLKFLMLIPVEAGAYFMFKVFSVKGSPIDNFLGNIWYFLGIFFYIATYFFYKKAIIIFDVLKKRMYK
ncbi:hypothetical protein OSSY52_11200 [Tepiditoga spiralis]|uniref:DUF2232 domain-containing protein n=1 Tax=Tepiditoga spiralis TaxID=2108365 RepID=A0A7G1GBC9_9BACT|nr:hypothetical protein [Tepiditoga spiralis]BBE30979.1 hypothetical protein OSSY52_11200 [Tepiditoga spiralis]